MGSPPSPGFILAAAMPQDRGRRLPSSARRSSPRRAQTAATPDKGTGGSGSPSTVPPQPQPAKATKPNGATEHMKAQPIERGAE